MFPSLFRYFVCLFKDQDEWNFYIFCTIIPLFIIILNFTQFLLAIVNKKSFLGPSYNNKGNNNKKTRMSCLRLKYI